MIEIEIDNKKVEVAEGSMVIQAADAAGIYIPRFCYHKKLSIPANCRMCLIEVDNTKKPLPACATPVVAGMKVKTQSQMALEAQRAVMEFLLINHPLDCPICDQGGECELQDLSLGYGNDVSRYYEGKRSVVDEDLGPLIATEMTRCIQCTRCVRFGKEVAGLPELGTMGRGENLEISTYINNTIRSELSGNIIDLCPVGALTSKPYRFSARAWELKQHVSVAPHDCIGSNLFVHTRGYEYNDYRLVMRVVPRENEQLNETWLSDRDRFSYEGLKSTDRLLTPKIKRESEWVDVDWSTALNYVIERYEKLLNTHGADQIGAIASPNSTVEEFYLLQKLFRRLGSNHLDHRIRQLDFSQQDSYPLYPQLNFELGDIENADTIFLVGSDIRKEQPLVNHRIRKASLSGAQVVCVNAIDYDSNVDSAAKLITPMAEIPRALLSMAKVLAPNNATITKLAADINPTAEEIVCATLLQQSNTRGVILLGIQALSHPNATFIQAICEEIASATGMRIGCLTEGANAAGGWLAGMIPHRGAAGSVVEESGADINNMFDKNLKSYLLLNIEPELDCINSSQAIEALMQAEFVVAMTPFVTELQEQYADVLLPMAPFFETSGTFINASNHWQTFEAVSRPLGEARPAWKILRVLGSLMQFEDFNYTHIHQVLHELQTLIDTMPKLKTKLELKANPMSSSGDELLQLSEWPMYKIDNLVRRSKPLEEWSAEENLLAARINQQVADKYGIDSGEIISISQDKSALDLPVIIDDRIAGNYVLLNAGISATAGFGQHMAPIKLLRGRGK